MAFLDDIQERDKRGGLGTIRTLHFGKCRQLSATTLHPVLLFLLSDRVMGSASRRLMEHITIFNI